MQIQNFIKANAIISSILFTLFLFAFSYAFFTPFFETNDDVYMMLCLKGKIVVSEQSEYLIFSNILLGYLLKFLYFYFPTFNWYSYYLVFFLYLGFTIFTYLLISHIHSKHQLIVGFFLYTLFFILFGLENLLYLQFTRVAGILATAGFLLILFSKSATIINLQVTFGVFCVVLASLARIQSTYLSFIIILLPHSFILFFSIPYNSKIKWVVTKSLSVVVAFLLCLSAEFYNIYQLEKWDSYGSYNALKGRIIDYEVLNKVDAATRNDILRNVGWTENDYQMFLHWFFIDSRYSLEKLEQIVEDTEKVPVLQKSNSLHVTFNRYDFHLFLFFGLIACVFFLKKPTKRELISVILLIMSVLLLKFIFIMMAFFLKPAPYRVLGFAYTCFVFEVWLLIFAFFTTTTAQLSYKTITYQHLFIILLTIGCLWRLSSLYIHSNQMKVKQNTLSLFMEQIPQGKIFISWGAGFPFEYIAPFHSVQNLNFYILSLGSRSVDNLKLFKHLNLDDIYLAILDKQITIFIQQKR
ncbi:MAG: hypothetical protein MUE81_08660, partial [Thermoflexibacter sp.]|nr:hypothetical protein [Thermoflexibacter sp.]